MSIEDIEAAELMEQIKSLPTDLILLSISYVDHYNGDLQLELREAFGSSCSFNFDFEFRNRLGNNYICRWPQSIYEAVVAAERKEAIGKKLNIHHQAQVSLDFLYEHGDEISILTHHSVPEEVIFDRLGKLDNLSYQCQHMEKAWRSRPISFIFKLHDRYPDLNMSDILSSHPELTDQIVEEHPEWFPEDDEFGYLWGVLTKNANLSPSFLIRNVDRLLITVIGSHPRCREILSDKKVLAKFLSSDHHNISTQYFGVWFFEENPGELSKDRIYRYEIHPVTTAGVLIPLFYKHLRPSQVLVGSDHMYKWTMIASHPSATEQMVREIVSLASGMLHHACNYGRISEDLMMELIKSLGITKIKHQLSFIRSLSPEFILKLYHDGEDALDMNEVLLRNDKLPLWLMQRSLARALGCL
jgi:hypothetical protein